MDKIIMEIEADTDDARSTLLDYRKTLREVLRLEANEIAIILRESQEALETIGEYNPNKFIEMSRRALINSYNILVVSNKVDYSEAAKLLEKELETLKNLIQKEVLIPLQNTDTCYSFTFKNLEEKTKNEEDK